MAETSYLPPELLLKVFTYIPNRKTQLALRSACKQFRDLVDRYGIMY